VQNFFTRNTLSGTFDAWLVATCPELDIVSQRLKVERSWFYLFEMVEWYFIDASSSKYKWCMKEETYVKRN